MRHSGHAHTQLGSGTWAVRISVGLVLWAKLVHGEGSKLPNAAEEKSGSPQKKHPRWFSYRTSISVSGSLDRRRRHDEGRLPLLHGFAGLLSRVLSTGLGPLVGATEDTSCSSTGPTSVAASPDVLGFCSSTAGLVSGAWLSVGLRGCSEVERTVLLSAVAALKRRGSSGDAAWLTRFISWSISLSKSAGTRRELRICALDLGIVVTEDTQHNGQRRKHEAATGSYAARQAKS